MGIDAPEKIGPMLRMADVIAVTKGDLVSQAEREVYRHRIRQMNRRAVIRHVNGLTGQGCKDLAEIIATGRQILLNGSAPDADERFELQGRLVAQLTQNMNFVLDTRVGDFIRTHTESRAVADPAAVAARVLDAGNQLAGEPFTPESQLTQLSGGQSRALMIADTALLSWSPVILIDEIENAGVDKRSALDLLIKTDKIIVIATHDPVLALAADRRLVFQNGGVKTIQPRSAREAEFLQELLKMEQQFSGIRNALRRGDNLISL
jgi:ABC-type lipoprotein export system ATPase subunit